MNLYQLTEEYRRDVERLAEVELPPEVVLETIESMQGDLAQKLRAVMCFTLELEAEATARAAEAKRMSDSARSASKRADALRSYAQMAIVNSGLTMPQKFPEFTLAMQKAAPTCDVSEPELLPPNCKFTEVSFRVPGLNAQFVRDNLLTDIHFAVSDLSVTTVPVKAAVLSALKEVAAANAAKPAGAPLDVLPGAYLNVGLHTLKVK